MSKSLMWAQSDTRDITARCLFNEDIHAYEVLVSSRIAGRNLRSETFPARDFPIWAMADHDYNRSLSVADRLMHDVAREIGDF